MIPVMIHYLRTFWIHQWRKWFCCIKVSKITQCQLIHLVTPKDSKEKAANSIKEPCSFLRFVTSAAVCFPVAPRLLPNLPLAHGAATLFPADWSKGPRSQRVHLELGWFEWTFLVACTMNRINSTFRSRVVPIHVYLRIYTNLHVDFLPIIVLCVRYCRRRKPVEFLARLSV